ncbi:uncharacterized protein RCC_01834 [Ramularia collo-cygni]|uniref:Uncharacterized protein n=1 Tax=Ramularia collo-cygni TaxID=112498 RepID=A0A2D3V0J9_9PEZI|nr:uncharacterized protein RCC_01834 [Ramularia collo-cygni]CZT15994.1 uncharacterized protein RCC_01834 [Ramularia collo-cygni]
MSFYALSLLILLALALVSLACAIINLVGAASDNKFAYIIWTTLSATLVYGIICVCLLAFWRKIIHKRNIAILQHEAMHHDDNASSIELQIHHSSSAPTTTTTTQTPRQQFRRSPNPHPGPLSSNPPNGPAFRSSIRISPHAFSLPAPRTASPTIPAMTAPRPVQMPGRTRAATHTGHTATPEEARRIRANSLVQIRAATARRTTVALPATGSPLESIGAAKSQD